jgi:membrane-associated phospholipid phosphatase
MEPMTSWILALAVSSTTTMAGSTPAYALRWEVDGAALAVGGVISFGWVLRDELAPPHCGLACDREDVFVLDRFAAGRFDPGWRTTSDVTIAATYGLAVGTLVLDGGLEGASDLVVVAESVLLSNAVGALVNLGARRPRPLAYGTAAPEDERLRGNTSLSFFSGHTAGAFAAALSTYATLRRRHPDSPLPYVALAVGVTAASFIGTTRVLAGDHFPTDVVAGALVGSALGLLLPALHDSPIRVSASSAGVAVAMDL